MYLSETTDIPRINARPSDAFDIFNLKHFVGPNPYLKTAAFCFDFALTGHLPPRPLGDYADQVAERFPQLQQGSYLSYAHLFAQVVAAANQLDMGLHYQGWTMKHFPECVRIIIETLHARTTRSVVYFIWDWFEAITQGEIFNFDAELRRLQHLFRQSVYGGPTVYALLRAAHSQGIPTFYLWDEGLMQYGYGRKQVRGVATTFDRDSNLDSDFTTRKDDCKAFLAAAGFPVPRGAVVGSLKQALGMANKLGYPLVIKPVAGHKGIGVTANIQNAQELEFAFEQAVQAIPDPQPIEVIVEQHIQGSDFRLLCVAGKFVAATERQPASVVGDGFSTIGQLIERENEQPARLDTPTSSLGKIQWDEAMEMFLAQQALSVNSVLAAGQKVFLRKVANLSAGGVSLDATQTLHPDNIVLAQDIAQYFRLTCLGIDVIAPTLATSWKAGQLGIIEINAAPGIYMHLKPAIGESVDVPTHILNTFFATSLEARIPIFTFNRLRAKDLLRVVNHILDRHPNWTIGGVCQEGVWINRSQKVFNPDYNRNIESLLRHPHLDLLIAEYPEDVLYRSGMFYGGSDLVVLEDPSETEMILARDVLGHGSVILQKSAEITIRSSGKMEQFVLADGDLLQPIYLQMISQLLAN